MTVWLTVVAIAAGTAAIKAAGPVALGRHTPSQRLADVIALVAPALLAALVVYETVQSGDGGLALDARLVGVFAALACLLLRLPLVVVIAVAAAATAAARALG